MQTMSPSRRSLRDDALAIWNAGVDAVRSERLVAEHLWVDGRRLIVGDETIDLRSVRHIAVVGAGKAGAGMAAAVETALGPTLLAEKHAVGWVNVPADCVRPLSHVHLHAARPAGVNEPTAAGVYGSERILEIVGRLGPEDLCLALISGGGSALLPAPVAGVTLDEKLALTRLLSSAGADIREMNAVRKPLSRIKGGGLARACGAGQLIALIISDVLGDPLDVIASGPTVQHEPSPAAALEVLRRFQLDQRPELHGIVDVLRRAPAASVATSRCQVTNLVIGNNAVAVDAAGAAAERLGYRHALHAATGPEGTAEEVGAHLARMAIAMRGQAGPNCLITGGEPVVRLVEASRRGRGGRNQQLVLAAMTHLPQPLPPLAVLSGGTDGEDGPTDAAGALIDEHVAAAAQERRLDPHEYLRHNDAYSFFEQTGGLIKTGPTHTNVCDVRVVLVDRS